MHSPAVACEQVHDSLWIAEGEIVDFYGFAYPTRSVVVRLDNGDLWVWSPVRLTEAIIRDLQVLGPVRHLVSPNKLHHLYLQDWKQAFPEAQLWGPASTIKKRRDLKFHAALRGLSPAEWQGEIDQAWFTGSLIMDEVVFFHRPSRTVIVADLIEALTEEFLREHWPWWMRLLARVDGIAAQNPGAPREWRVTFLDRLPARAARQKVLGWSADRVVMAHGDWVRKDGHAYLERSLAWLGPPLR
ncbi:DUF4336 domain-containing protein [Phenylobacterium montanum]|uniref:DUF4336 domain-containing protein n=1 Tax=Phenylobacterium montanum TaxID=2823693 RepID=A0A975IVZ1_9CAUL|nr:DUF4336 domain-containing protein [Caulobacter sp. S6]QUD89522.1 DUF4336 domain-containing protein [Caulobacter sp. S6]